MIVFADAPVPTVMVDGRVLFVGPWSGNTIAPTRCRVAASDAARPISASTGGSATTMVSGNPDGEGALPASGNGAGGERVAVARPRFP